MEKIDRLGWAAGLVISAYGLRVGLRTDRPELMAQIVERLPPAWKRASTPTVEVIYSLKAGSEGAGRGMRRFNLLYFNTSTLSRSLELDEVLERFESSLRLYIGEFSPRRVFVHAGVVGWRGKAIIIPGRSFSGKTTLVKELVRAGAVYYSDEYAVLDQNGNVYPFAKPLSVRKHGAVVQTQVPVQALGGRAGVRRLPVGLVVVSSYQPGAKWRARRLTAGKGALEVLAHTVPARRRPDASLATLQRVVSQAPVVKVVRGEAQELVEHILNYFQV